MRKRTKSVLKHIATSLWRQAVANEKSLELYRESVALQRQSADIARQNMRYSREVSAVAKRNLIDRLQVECRQAELEDEASRELERKLRLAAAINAARGTKEVESGPVFATSEEAP